jgi:hypothetical protein
MTENGCRVLLTKNKLLHAERVIEALQPAEDVVPVVQMVRKADIREMLFPDTWVIIPCSVWLKNRDSLPQTRVDSASYRPAPANF